MAMVAMTSVFAGVLGASAALADEVLVVTGSNSPSVALNKSQVSNVFLGKSTTLPNGGAAVPVDQPESSPLRDEFYLKLTNMSASQVKAQWAKLHFTGRGVPPKEIKSVDELKKTLNASPGAIGYIDKSALDSSLQVIYTIK